MAMPGGNPAHTGSESSLLAAAHNPSNTPQGRLQAAEKCKESQIARGAPNVIDPEHEASIGQQRADERHAASQKMEEKSS